MGDVQNRAVLNIGARADANNLHITPHRRMGPNAGSRHPAMNVAHHHRRWVNHAPDAPSLGATPSAARICRGAP